MATTNCNNLSDYDQITSLTSELLIKHADIGFWGGGLVQRRNYDILLYSFYNKQTNFLLQLLQLEPAGRKLQFKIRNQV